MTWRAVVGIQWPDGDGDGEARAEAGEIVPTSVVEAAPWLIEQGAVEAVEAEPETNDG